MNDKKETYSVSFRRRLLSFVASCVGAQAIFLFGMGFGKSDGHDAQHNTTQHILYRPVSSPQRTVQSLDLSTRLQDID